MAAQEQGAKKLAEERRIQRLLECLRLMVRTSCFWATSTRLLERFRFMSHQSMAGWRTWRSLCGKRCIRWVCGCCSSAFRGSQILPMYVDNTPLSSPPTHPLRVGQVSSIREILGLAVYSWRTSTVFPTSRVLAGQSPGRRCCAVRRLRVERWPAFEVGLDP